jgi:hypothetical protein
MASHPANGPLDPSPPRLAPEAGIARAAAGLALVTVVVMAGVVGVWEALPAQREWIGGEDGPVEWLTAAGFLAASLVFLYRQRQQRFRGTAGTFFFWAAVAGAVLFLEELSFGARIAHVAPPVVYGHPFDGLHDVIEVAYLFTRDALAARSLPRLTVVALVALVGLGIAWRLAGVARRSIVAVWRLGPTGRFAFVAIAWIGIALVLDLDRWTTHLMRFMEEVLELNAAVTAVFAAVAAVRLPRPIAPGGADPVDPV